MNTITSAIVESTWKDIQDVSDEDMGTRIGKLGEDQPLLMAYLVSVGEQLLEEEEEELLFFYGLLIWQMMSQGNRPLPEMVEETLSNAEKGNVDLVTYLDNGPDSEFRNEFKTLLENYNQPHILNFVVEVITEGVEDENIRPQSYGPMILYLKVVIDGLDG